MLLTKSLFSLGYAGVIFSGCPGTSKSWYAYQIASILAENNSSRVRFIQFHPSYQYEDFVAGWSPSDENSSFVRRKRHLLEMNDLANSIGKPCYLVLDELSRCDPSRIFGEALTYIEPTKRGIRFKLACGLSVILSKHLYFIATMNPWDRSVSDVDAAFERRFATINLIPDHSELSTHLAKHSFPGREATALVEWFKTINAHSNPYCRIGHAYFYPAKTIEELRLIWKYQIRPTLFKAFAEAPKDFDEIETKWDEAIGK